ncbi:MAG TPA: hypothetical protein P5328_02735 [Candidatus Paceibacterota bacterium]|nr:hypothetical protein [Candidatus Paceibacterota bacterium]HRZ34357.1 hypothetical protein [Candidatus Paceibacterota bacterium]
MNTWLKKLLSIIGLIVIVWAVSAIYANNIKGTATGTSSSGSLQMDTSGISFFYSQTCPHCHEEQKFLDQLQQQYPDLKINRYDVSKRETTDLLQKFNDKYNVGEYLGVVPLTFVYETLVVGFNTPETTGKTIIDLVESGVLKNESQNLAATSSNDNIGNTSDNGIIASDDKNYSTIEQLSNLSLFGIRARDLSFPILSVVLGFFDGFNVCSLGALLLILSLVFVFKSRKKTLLYGGIFLLVTGITYAALIFLWFGLFSFFARFVSLFQALIGAIGLVGGIYFLRQYIRFLKYGPLCEVTESKWIKNVTQKMREAFQGNKKLWVVILAVVIFSFIVTVIEFPCSAVIPVAFAAILTEAGVTIFAKAIYLFIFMLLYLADEIIVFLIAVFTMKIWIGGEKLTKHLTLIQAIVFIILGAFYIYRFLI